MGFSLLNKSHWKEVHHNTLYFAYTWSFMISSKKSFSNKLNTLGECNNNKRRILFTHKFKEVCFKSGFFGFWCSQCVPTKLPSSFQNVHIKFPPCPNAFLICSPSSQDVPKRTTHFNPMTFAQSWTITFIFV
jgi:hypothetical protein